MKSSFRDRCVLMARRPFVRHVLILVSGTAGAQIIAMVLMPAITRLYGPEAFGLLDVFVCLAALLTPVAALTYPIAMVLPREEAEARGIARLSIGVAVALSLGVGLAILAGGKRLPALAGAAGISDYAGWLPVVMLLAALTQVAESGLLRRKHFDLIAGATVLQAAMVNAGRIALGWAYPSAGMLIVSFLLGEAFLAGALYGGRRRTAYAATSTESETKAFSPLQLVRRYADFPLYRAPQVFVNAITHSLPVLMLASFFGPASAGYYALCRRLLGVPAQLLGKSVGDVFYPRIAEAHHRGESLSRLILKTTVLLAAVGFVPFALVAAWGPRLFGWVFGAEWTTAGEYARWVAVFMFFMFLNGPSVKALPVLSAQRFFLLFSLVTMAARFAALAFGYYGFHSDRMAVALFGLSGGLTNLVLIVIVVCVAWARDRERR